MELWVGGTMQRICHPALDAGSPISDKASNTGRRCRLVGRHDRIITYKPNHSANSSALFVFSTRSGLNFAFRAIITP